MRIDSDGNAKRPRQPEISQLDDTLAVDEEILWFEIAMQDASLVTELDAFSDLVQVALWNEIIIIGKATKAIEFIVFVKFFFF